MASNSGWDKTTPSNTSSAALGDDEFRSLKSFMQAWWDEEHFGTTGSAGSAGVHQLGSARPFVGLASSVSTKGDEGRLMWTTDAEQLAILQPGSIRTVPSLGTTNTFSAAQTFSGAVTFGSTVAITGAATFSSTINGQTISSAASLTGTLAVTGLATFAGAVKVSGASTTSSSLSFNSTSGFHLRAGTGSLYDFRVLTSAGSDILSVPTGTQNVALAGTLAVTGATTLSSTLAVTGATTLSSTLTLGGKIVQTSNGSGIWVNAGNVASLIDFDFDASLTTATGSARFFRDTNTTGGVTFAVYNGLTASPAAMFEVSNTSGSVAAVVSGTLSVTGTTTLSTTILGASMVYTGANQLVIADTSDGSDNKRLLLVGAGAASNSRGAYIGLHGNQYATDPGFLYLVPGSSAEAAGSEVQVAGAFHVTAAVTLDTTLAVTGASTLTGNVGIGGASNADRSLWVLGTPTPAAGAAYGVVASPVFSSSTTSVGRTIRSAASTAAAVFTLPELSAFYVSNASKGAGSTITNQYGLYIESLTSGASNFAIYTNDGLVRFGGAVTATSTLAVTGAITASGGVVGDLTGNADTATALATARTIWGQSFDGSGNVTGAFSGATTGAFSSSVTVGGTLGVTGATTLAALTATTTGLGNTTITGNLEPEATGTRALGSASKRWGTTYTNILDAASSGSFGGALTVVGTATVGALSTAGAVTAASLNLGGATVADVLSNTVTHDPLDIGGSGTIAVGSRSATFNVTVTGAVVGDVVAASNPWAIDSPYLDLIAWVSAADTVSMTVINNGSSGTNPTSRTSRVVVFKF